MTTTNQGQGETARVAEEMTELALRYERKREETKAAEKADDADYSWTWNYYEGVGKGLRMALRILADPAIKESR